METTHHAAQMGGSLSMAVDRLDRALLALEGRLRNLQAGGASGGEGGGVSEATYQDALRELEEARSSNAALASAANQAFDALGSAAKNIRNLLAYEVA